ncbi:unnamed protein product, partial [Laminaria digitata]
ADAAREAAEESQSRMIAEMSALEERVDRRAREEARRAREEREAAEARVSMRRVSSTVSAYTADLATRLEGVRSDQSLQGADVARAAEEIAAAEAELRSLGSELVGLGQVANNVSMVVDGKADQTDVEALRLAMQRLDGKVAAKDRGAASAARDAEAISALEAAFKDMSFSMESSMRKLQQSQKAAGNVKIKPLLDRVVKELTAAGMLPDADDGQGAVGRSVCLSCNRPMAMSGPQQPSKFAAQFRGRGAAGLRADKDSSTPLQVSRPAVVWRGGFKMPPSRTHPQDRNRYHAPGNNGGGGGGGVTSGSRSNPTSRAGGVTSAGGA